MPSPAYRTTAPVRNLALRSSLLQQLRRFFDERGFLEVQTPVLSQHTVIDRHIDPMTIPVRLPGEPKAVDYFLQSSPEAAMKRLLACGMERIYQVGPVFREGEVGRYHNPEFTLAEWYRVGDDYEAGIELLDQLVQRLLGTPPARRVSFQKAFLESVGIDVLAASVVELASRAVQLGVISDVDWTDDWDDWVHVLFSVVVQPVLGHEQPVIITHFPASQAALARVSSNDARVAERFEYFYRGIELANGYHELLDAEVLRERNLKANDDRRRDGKSPLPEASFLLDAMEAGMPPSTGCALGFDRLVMIACGASHIEEVIPFPIGIA